MERKKTPPESRASKSKKRLRFGYSWAKGTGFFLAKAEEVLQHMHEVDIFAASLSDQYVAEASVGIIDSCDRAKIAGVGQCFLAELPQVMLHFHQGASDDILNKVRKKELSAGFFIGKNPYRNVYSIHLESLRYVVIAPISMVPEIEHGNGRSLNALPWLDMPDYSAGSKVARQFWREQKILPRTVLTSDKMALNTALCGAQLGLSLVPEKFAQLAIASGEKIEVLHEFCIEASLSFIYANEFEKDFKTQALIRAVRKTWQIAS